jgi:hypothetical protein
MMTHLQICCRIMSELLFQYSSEGQKLNLTNPIIILILVQMFYAHFLPLNPDFIPTESHLGFVVSLRVLRFRLLGTITLYAIRFITSQLQDRPD